jgi:hypothetical protein
MAARRLVLLLVGSGLVALAGTGSVHALDLNAEQTRTTSNVIAATIHGVVVDDNAGDITIVPGSPIRVVAAEHYRLKAPTVTEQVTGGVLTVKVRCAQLVVNNCYTDLVLTVPTRVTVEGSTAAGAVSTRSLIGDEQLRSAAGDISAAHIAASVLRLSTGAGNISATAAQARQVSATSSSGGVTIDDQIVPDSVIGRSAAGDVSVSVPTGHYAVTSRADAGRTSIQGLVVDPSSPHTISATSSSGDITIKGH